MKKYAFVKATILFAFIFGIVMIAGTSKPAFAWVSDNGNGTYTNMVMWGDYPDNDVIRVGTDYYMVSTSMNMIPGVPIMKSKDLVNWEFSSYAVARMDSPTYNFVGGDEYNEGPWATSLRYNNGTFYVLFNSNREGAYLATATDAAGPWTLNKILTVDGKTTGVQLYDPGMFFDDDGKVYVVHGQGTLYVTELTADGKQVKTPQQMLYTCNTGSYCEGSRVYKRNGVYVVLNTPTWSQGSKKEVVHTATNIYGPYGQDVDIMTSFSNWTGGGVHQGAIVDTPTGEWWAIIMQDRFPYGRLPTLQPVTWVGNYPIMGINKEAVVTYPKPNVGGTVTTTIKEPVTSDEFDSTTLGLIWQWNHNPDDTKWSLTERPGFMRLKTANVTSNLTYARNTLTQRILGPDSTAIIKMDITNMANGDFAGLSIFNKDNSFIAVNNVNGIKRIVVKNLGIEVANAPFSGNQIWFKAESPKLSAKVNYYFSTDGINFKQLGGSIPIIKSGYVGARFGIFTYAPIATGGYVDVDWFHITTSETSGNVFPIGQTIEAERYDDKSSIKLDWANDQIIDGKDQYAGTIVNGSWLKFDQIDFGSGATNFSARVATPVSGSNIEVRLNSPTGTLLSTCAVTSTGGWQTWVTQSCNLSNSTVTGKNKVYLVFTGSTGNLVNMNWFRLDSNLTIPQVPTNLNAAAVNSSQINVKWDASPGAFDYDLEVDGTVVNTLNNSYPHLGLAGNSTHTYRVRAKNSLGSSAWSSSVSTATIEELVPQSLMTATATSQEMVGENGSASNVLDGNRNTIWHTKWDLSNPLPQSITLNLGGAYNVTNLKYLPRKSGNDHGNITGYNFYTSMDGTNFTKVATGSWANDTTEKNARLSSVTMATYVKLEATAGVGGWASAAELNVNYDTPVLIPHSQMTATATSEETAGANNLAANVLDGNNSTIWHTKWNLSNPLPQSITLNLGGSYKVSNLKYLPRQSGSNGNITSYNIYVSSDGTNFTKVANGSWANDAAEKSVQFSPVTASYVKLEATAGIGGWASAAEINVFRSSVSP